VGNKTAPVLTPRAMFRLAGTPRGIGCRHPGQGRSRIRSPLVHDLDLLRKNLDPQRVTIQTFLAICPRLDASRCRAPLEALPKGDSSASATLRSSPPPFWLPPRGDGPAIALYHPERRSKRVYRGWRSRARRDAILLFMALRRVVDVLLTLAPLVLAGCDARSLRAGRVSPKLRTSSHAAMLGVGVAFKIYYTMAWRAGKTGLLQSTLTRAVVFSAMTNAVAFGSMWSSSYPAYRAWAKLMALALLCTMAAAFWFQPC